MFCSIMSMGVTILGRRLSNDRSNVNSVYIETSQRGNLRKEDSVMLTISELIAVIGFAVTCFALGYSGGRNSKA